MQIISMFCQLHAAAKLCFLNQYKKVLQNQILYNPLNANKLANVYCLSTYFMCLSFNLHSCQSTLKLSVFNQIHNRSLSLNQAA